MSVPCIGKWEFSRYISKVNLSEMAGSRNQMAADEEGPGAKDVEAESVNQPF